MTARNEACFALLLLVVVVVVVVCEVIQVKL